MTASVQVPGPADPGGISVRALPLPPLPAALLRKVPARVRERILLASNPCRLRLGDDQIVVFREDIVEKLRRQCVVPPTDDENTSEISQHAVKTIIDQAHLCPVAASGQPVTWQYDHCLRLYPVPHVVVLADRAAQFDHLYDGCRVLNPSSFHIDFSFVEYALATSAANFLVVKLKPLDSDGVDAADDAEPAEQMQDSDVASQPHTAAVRSDVDDQADVEVPAVVLIVGDDAVGMAPADEPIALPAVELGADVGGAFAAPLPLADDDTIVDDFTDTRRPDTVVEDIDDDDADDDDIAEDDPRRVVLDDVHDDTEALDLSENAKRSRRESAGTQ
jgi:hypothetical protein